MAGMPDPTTYSQGGFPTAAGLAKLGSALGTVAKERIVDPVVNTAKVIDSAMREQTPMYVADDTGNVTFNPVVGDALMNVALGMTGGAGMIPAEANSLRMGAKGIRGWHGGVEDFDKFDLSKAGTGQGQAVYGHGVYIGGAEPIGMRYRDLVASRKGLESKIGDTSLPDYYLQLQARQKTMNPWSGEAMKLSEKMDVIERMMLHKEPPETILGRKLSLALTPEAQGWLRGTVIPKYKPAGKMYEVNINASPQEFISWDQGITPNNPLAPVLDDVYRTVFKAKGVDEYRVPSEIQFTGNRYYKDLADLLGKRGASETLREAGIKGIKAKEMDELPFQKFLGFKQKELQAASQALEKAKPDSYEGKALQAYSESLRKDISDLKEKNVPVDNYVVFDDKLIDILRKYGLIGAAGAAGYGLMDPDSAQAAPQPKGMMQGARDAIQ